MTFYRLSSDLSLDVWWPKSRWRDVALPRNMARGSPCCSAWDFPHWGHPKAPWLTRAQLWVYFLFCSCWPPASTGRTVGVSHAKQKSSRYFKVFAKRPKSPCYAPISALAVSERLVKSFERSSPRLPKHPGAKRGHPASEQHHLYQQRIKMPLSPSLLLQLLFISSTAQRPLKSHWAAFDCVSVG